MPDGKVCKLGHERKTILQKIRETGPTFNLHTLRRGDFILPILHDFRVVFSEAARVFSMVRRILFRRAWYEIKN